MEPRSRIRLIAAGTIGNVLEWYGFAIYGYFAISIGKNFFPGGDPVAQVLAAFGVFAVVHRSGIDLSPALVAMAAAGLSLAAALTFREANPRESRR
ncbi:MAG: hypothetical protein HYX38_16860 [Rhodospirillales bacterium]|nr:hypothetical protein [Rhodospirillales bacterium]